MISLITKLSSRNREEEMLEYVAYTLVGVVTICCLLYVTMSPEAEDAPKPPDPKQ